MTGFLPQFHEGRDGPRELVKLVNQLRRNSPLPTLLLPRTGPLDLLTSDLLSIVPPNSPGWITTSAYVIADEITGVQSGAPFIRIGTAAGTFSDVVASTSLGTTLVVGELVPLTLVSPVVSLDAEIFVSVDVPGSGPTVLTASVYLEGFFR